MRLRWFDAKSVVVLAVVATLVATAVRGLLHPILGSTAPFFSYVIAIVLVTQLRGALCGWLTLGLGLILGDFFFVDPSFGFIPTTRDGAYTLIAYLGVGAALVLLIGSAYRSRRRLERAMAWLDGAMAVSSVGTWDIDLTTDTAEASAAVSHLYGYTDGRTSRPVSEWIERVHPDDLELAQETLREAQENSRSFEIEHRIIRPDGSVVWVIARGRPVKGEDGHAHIVGVIVDITARKRADAERALVAEEAQHRARNIFAIILSVVGTSLSPSEERQRLTNRLHALAESFTLSFGPLSRVSLSMLIERELKPFDTSRVEASGEAVSIPATYAMALGLCLHELASNAAKYGALSTPSGRVSITWHWANGILDITWTESGGPPVTPPTHKGFGTKLIARSLTGHRGEVRQDFRPEGLVAHISLPLDGA